MGKLTLSDHSRYAFFRNRSISIVPKSEQSYFGPSKAQSLHFWRWWQNAAMPNMLKLDADMPRHAMLFEYRHKDWRKSAPKVKPIRNRRKCVRAQGRRGCFNVFLTACNWS